MSRTLALVYRMNVRIKKQVKSDGLSSSNVEVLIHSLVPLAYFENKHLYLVFER